MPPSAADIVFDHLTVDERLELIGRIWDSLPSNPVPVQPWHLELVRERLAEAKANPGASVPLDELRQQLLEGKD